MGQACYGVETNLSRGFVERKGKRSKGTDFANECRMEWLGCFRELGEPMTQPLGPLDLGQPLNIRADIRGPYINSKLNYHLTYKDLWIISPSLGIRFFSFGTCISAFKLLM